ncbi:MAG: 50S ribosomal protein L17 [Flavobacteriaceae bacterium]
MRHGKKVAHLGRTNTHRKAMLANMASSLIEHKRINTTVARAKALKTFIEPLITRSKEDSTHNRRIAFRALRNKYAVTELFRTVSEKIGDRPGGYTRIIKLGNRLGDNADMAMIELVDFNEVYETAKPKKKSRRRSRKKESAPATAAEESVEAAETTDSVAEVTAEEAPQAEATEATEDAPEKTDANEDENKAE